MDYAGIDFNFSFSFSYGNGDGEGSSGYGSIFSTIANVASQYISYRYSGSSSGSGGYYTDGGTAISASSKPRIFYSNPRGYDASNFDPSDLVNPLYAGGKLAGKSAFNGIKRLWVLLRGGKSLSKANKIADFFKGTKYSDKVLQQMKKNDFHGFPELVKDLATDGTIKTIKGGDGIVRKMLEIPGSYKGRDGVFEFIKEADGTINHRFFNPY